MRKAITLAALVCVGSLLTTTGLAADISSILGGEPKDSFNLIHVRDLSKLMNGDNRVYIYDANPPDVRSNEGIIPGAKLLASSDKYDIVATLPADKKAALVFYCHNVH
jgi:hypothetical protein